MGSNNFNNADFEYFSIVRVCVVFPKLYYLTFYGISLREREGMNVYVRS